MNFDADSDSGTFRQEVRAFLAEHVTDEMRETAHRTGTMHSWPLHKKLAEAGLLAASWPVEVGGGGRSAMEMLALAEEFNAAAAPVDGLVTTSVVGRTLLAVGTAFQRTTIVPRVVAGKILIALGYSESDAGSDVASVKSRAVQHDGTWTINGSKMFTTLAHESEYVFFLARTGEEGSKHRGLTMFLVPVKAEGVEVRPIQTLGGERTNLTFYNDVEVADELRVGEVDGGWDVMKVALAFERDMVMNGQLSRLQRDAWEWAGADTRRQNDTTQERLGRISVDLDVANLLVQRQAWLADKGELPIIAGSMAKLFSSEAFQRAASSVLDAMGPAGVLEEGPGVDPATTALVRAFRHSAVLTIYGGTSEIQRSIIAERHLGLPRTR